MNKLTINDIRMFLLKRDELAFQIDEALRLYLPYYKDVHNSLSQVCSSLMIDQTQWDTQSFMGVWERYFKDEVGWYGFELVENHYEKISLLSIKRDTIGYDGVGEIGDAVVETVELKIPIGLIVDPVKYIKDSKSLDYDYLTGVIAEAKKEVYKYQMRLEGYPLFEANNIVRRDLEREENIIKELEPFLIKMR